MKAFLAGIAVGVLAGIYLIWTMGDVAEVPISVIGKWVIWLLLVLVGGFVWAWLDWRRRL